MKNLLSTIQLQYTIFSHFYKTSVFKTLKHFLFTLVILFWYKQNYLLGYLYKLNYKVNLLIK